MLRALESLPRSDRDLIVTRYLHGQDYGTMARERGRKPDQVRRPVPQSAGASSPCGRETLVTPT